MIYQKEFSVSTKQKQNMASSLNAAAAEGKDSGKRAVGASFDEGDERALAQQLNQEARGGEKEKQA